MARIMNPFRLSVVIFFIVVSLVPPSAFAGEDRGDFVPVWVDIQNPGYREIQAILQEGKALESLAKDPRAKVALNTSDGPKPADVEFDSIRSLSEERTLRILN